MEAINPFPWQSLPGPQDITRSVLPNGIVLLVRPNFHSPSVAISGYLASGSIYDPPGKLGLAHFTALCLTRGTRERDFQQIFDLLESSAASLGYGASVHTTSFGGHALVEDLPLLLDLLADTLRHPTFPSDQVERLRAQLLTHLAIRAQDTSDMASLRFDELLFPGHPYGRPEDGYAGTIGAISREDLVDCHTRCFGPRGLVLAVVGGITPQEVLEAVEHWLGDWQNPAQAEEPPMPPLPERGEMQREYIAIPGKSQNDLVVGTLGPRRVSEDYLPASLGNSVLGQFGMMGRIGDVVREQAGLAYYASTSLNTWVAGGSWEVSAGVNPANVQKAIDLILEELKRFTREPVSVEELEDSQTNFIGRLPLSLESNAGVAATLLNMERFDLGLDYLQRYPKLVADVTPAQVLESARRYIDPERMVIVSAG